MRNQEMIRQWSILRELDAKRHLGVHINELAERERVTTRTIRRDLEALDMGGFPLQQITRDGRSYWKLDDRTFARLADIGLSLPELCALYFGRSIMGCLLGPPFRDDLGTAFGKITKVLPQRLRSKLEEIESAFVMKGDPRGEVAGFGDEKHVTHLVNAVLWHRRVGLRYYSVHSRRQKDYVVEPVRIVLGQGALYLRAFVPDYGEIRTFAVSRMLTVSPTEQTFTPHVEDAADPFRDSLGINDGPPIEVEVQFTSRVARYVEERKWHRSQKVEGLPDGGLRVRLTVSDDLALRSWILGFGSDARVVAPDSLAERVRDELEQMRAAYAHAGPPGGQAGLPFEAVAPHVIVGAPAAAPATRRRGKR